MFTLLLSNAFLAALVTWIVYLVVGGIYRLYFHPLAKFPGPKIAALTGWYEFYHDFYRHGMLMWKLQELHDKYGMWKRFLFLSVTTHTMELTKYWIRPYYPNKSPRVAYPRLRLL